MHAKSFSLLTALLTFIMSIVAVNIHQYLRASQDAAAKMMNEQRQARSRLNPKVVAHDESVQVISETAHVDVNVAPEDLGRVLSSLPESAWPDGRWIHVEGICFHSLKAGWALRYIEEELPGEGIQIYPQICM